MKNKLGFTLLELLVVVLIIGILAAIALPQYYYLINSVKTKTQMNIVKDIVDAQHRYYLINDEYANNIKLLDKDFSDNSDFKYYGMTDGYIVLRNDKTDIRIGYAWEDWGKVPAGNFFCYYYNSEYLNSTLSRESKEKICRKVCNNEIQNTFPVTSHAGCVVKA